MSPLLLLSLLTLPAEAGSRVVPATATLAEVRQSREELPLASFTHEKTTWKLMCKGNSTAALGVECAAVSGDSRREVVSLGYIGETEKNLGVKLKGFGSGFMVEISGVNAG